MNDTENYNWKAIIGDRRCEDIDSLSNNTNTWRFYYKVKLTTSDLIIKNKDCIHSPIFIASTSQMTPILLGTSSMRIKGTNSIGFRDIAKAGNLVINGDTTITDSGIYAKGSITINGNGITIIDNPAVANTVPTAVDTTLATPLKKIFDLNKIETGFDIATTLGQNLNEFRTIKARDIDAIGQTVARDAKGNIIKDPVTGKPMTVAQVAQLPSTDARYISALGAVDADKVNPLSKYNDLQSAWGNGGWGTIVLTSLAGAANGNVTGGTAQLVQNSAINTIQQFAIQGNKALAANINNSLLSAGVKNLLHTIVNCGAAEMKGGSCGTAAGATAATVALNALFNVPVKTMSESEKLAYSNLIQTILAGVATGANVNAAEAVFSGKAEVENNAFGLKGTADIVVTGGMKVVDICGILYKPCAIAGKILTGADFIYEVFWAEKARGATKSAATYAVQKLLESKFKAIKGWDEYVPADVRYKVIGAMEVSVASIGDLVFLDSDKDIIIHVGE